MFLEDVQGDKAWPLEELAKRFHYFVEALIGDSGMESKSSTTPLTTMSNATSSTR